MWAPSHRAVDVVIEGNRKPVALRAEGNGYFSAFLEEIGAGARYRYSLGKDALYPDPASCFQPDGPHGPSQVMDPEAFPWTDLHWRGIRLEGQVFYELHLGTFTPEGTWDAAAAKLPHLKETGITVLELMPVADFPGRFGWGYDGVQAYAPVAIYGTPDDMRRFVDRAHSLGIAVILDVVYNHLGPDGNYLSKYSPFYFSETHKTDWGPAINFDAKGCSAVREYFRDNAAYWVRDFHLDGLRLDATQDIHDQSQPHILTEICQAARHAAGERSIVLIAENEPQNTRLIRPLKDGGYGLDALWNDDFHHSAIVALTGHADAYYSDHRGSSQEFLSAAKYGYLFQGQSYRWQKKRRGHSTLGLPRAAMVTFIQNHDQIANSARGQRVHQLTSPGRLKAMTAFTLLAPGTPMLFQGQEFAASAPFLFFADHKPELAKLIRTGRVEFLEQWRSLQLPEMKKCFADPAQDSTFLRCKLDWSELETHDEIYALHRDLLRLRREDRVIARQGADGIDGAVLSPSCFVIRYFTPAYDRDRLLLINLGTDLEFSPAPEPLLGPPAGTEWTKLWSSEDLDYGGCGTPPLDTDDGWRIPGESAVLLYPVTLNR